MRKPVPILWDLLRNFMKIGLFTFGGGYAMISVITDTCVEEKGWLTHEEMMDLTVIAESTPGPIAINCATYVGCKMAGLPGAVVATLGIVFPSFVIIYAVSGFLGGFLEVPLIAKAFQGIKAAVGLLILDAGITMAKKMKKKPQTKGFALFGFFSMLVISLFSLKISTITLMLMAGMVSLALFLKKDAAAGKGGGEG